MSKENKEIKKELNIYQKLVEVRKQVEYVQKSAKGYNFKYCDENSILSAIRPEMDKLGIILELDMLEPTQINDKICQVGFVFTWINADAPSEQIEKKLYLQGPIGDVQKMGGLLTYANRFFLYKYFNVPTGEMDPDSRAVGLTSEQMSYLEREINGDVELRKKMLDWAQAKDFSELKAEQFETIKRAVAKHKADKHA